MSLDRFGLVESSSVKRSGRNEKKLLEMVVSMAPVLHSCLKLSPLIVSIVAVSSFSCV